MEQRGPEQETRLVLVVSEGGFGVISRSQKGYLDVFVKDFLKNEIIEVTKKERVFEKNWAVFCTPSRDQKSISIAVISYNSNDSDSKCLMYEIFLLQGVVKKVKEVSMNSRAIPEVSKLKEDSKGLKLFLDFQETSQKLLLDHNTIFCLTRYKVIDSSRVVPHIFDVVTSTFKELELRTDFDLKVLSSQQYRDLGYGVVSIETGKMGRKTFLSERVWLPSLLIVDVLSKKILANISLNKEFLDNIELSLNTKPYSTLRVSKSRNLLLVLNPHHYIQVHSLPEPKKPSYKWKPPYATKESLVSLAFGDEGQVAFISCLGEANDYFYFCVPGKPDVQECFFSRLIRRQEKRKSTKIGYFIGENICLLDSGDVVFISTRDSVTLLWSVIQSYDALTQPLTDAPRYLSFDVQFKSLGKQCCIEQAIQHHDKEEYTEAIKYWNRLIAENPKEFYLLERRGESKRKLNQYPEALQDLNEALILNPKSDFALARRGEVKRQLYQKEEGLKDLEEAIKLNPNNDFALGVRDEVKQELEIQKSVSQGLQKSPKPDPKDSNAQQESGKIKKRMEDEQEAFLRKTKNLIVIPTEKLKLGRSIGEGNFGTVYKGEWQFVESYEMPIAIKQLKKEVVLSEKALRDFRKEVEIHAKLDCSQIVKLIGISDAQPFCMVMEFVELGSLRTLLDDQQDNPHAERIDWGVRLQIARDIATGVAYLHDQKPVAIVHGDLKSLNVLLTRDYRAKVCDFGLAKLKVEVSSRYYVHDNNEQANKPKGSLLWMAPELFSLTARRTTASDIFSLAVVLWELASFALPYEGTGGNKDVIEAALKMGDREIFDDERTPNTSKEYVELVESCWVGDPKKRPDAVTVIVKLEAIYSKYPLAPTVFSSSPKAAGRQDVSTPLAQARCLLTSSATSSQDDHPSQSYQGNIYK